MADFFRKTLCDPSIFWTAVEALATLAAFIFLLIEIPKFRREKASHDIAGLEYVLQQLQSKNFQQWSENLIDAWKKGDDAYSDFVVTQIVSILARMDFVAKLIDIGYLDVDLFYYVFCEDLWSLEKAITYFANLESYQLEVTFDQHNDGYKLLINTSKYFFSKYGSRK